MDKPSCFSRICSQNPKKNHAKTGPTKDFIGSLRQYIYIYIDIYAKQFGFIEFIYIVSVFVLNPEQESLSTSPL